MTTYIAVIGSGRASEEENETAEAVGSAVASSGAVLVCGGLGGVMEAASRGAKRLGGTTLGILPGTDRRAANEFVDVVVCTGIGESRNAIIVTTADAVIAVGGEFGTLSEIALALRAGKPVVGLRTWELLSPRTTKGQDETAIDQRRAIVEARGPAEAVAEALRLISPI